MTMKHLYGVVSTAVDEDITLDSPLYAVRVGQLTAVVKDIDIQHYRDIPQNELVEHLLAHQTVIETLLAYPRFLPAKFGSLFQTDAQIRTMLTAHKERLEATWREMAGLVQMEMVVLWDNQLVLQEIAAELGIAPEQADQSRAAQMALVQRQDGLEAVVREAVAPVAQELANQPLLDDDTAVDIALLIHESNLPQLDQALATIDKQTGGAYLIRCVGPLPPHSFVQIHAQAPKPEQIDHARQLLGLGLQTTTAEMKEAYRQHPYYSQPTQQSDLQSILQMTELAQCYKMLREVAASQPGEVCRLDEAAVASTVVLTIQKP
ncbi:MAG: GvpL/GvpF family gas vesicle protein [Anaerolineales bacterium]|nr:GvpL/GvpF family gas vesicle protein [Anaerolineales bacterium]